MNQDESTWILKLERSCELHTDTDFEDYSEAISNLRGSSSEEVLRRMLLCFRDTESGEIQYELLEACEEYSDDIYVKTFISIGQKFHSVSPRWFGLAFQSILNTPFCLSMAISRIRQSPDKMKQFYRYILVELAKTTPKYRPIIADIFP
jgi:hypothetical protein